MKTTILNDNQTSISEATSKKISDLDAIVALAAEKIRECSIKEKWTFGEWTEDWDEDFRADVPCFEKESMLFDNDSDEYGGFHFWVELKLSEKEGFKSAEVEVLTVDFENDEVYAYYSDEEEEYMRNLLDAQLYKFYN